MDYYSLWLHFRVDSVILKRVMKTEALSPLSDFSLLQYVTDVHRTVTWQGAPWSLGEKRRALKEKTKRPFLFTFVCVLCSVSYSNNTIIINKF